MRRLFFSLIAGTAIYSPWILDSGYWDDNAYWNDSSTWTDPIYSEQYQLVLGYAILNGITQPSDVEKLLQSNLAAAMYSSGVYSKSQSILVPMGDGSNDFKLIDWSTGTKRATANGTLVYSNTQGIKSNGTDGYVDAGYIPSSGQNNQAFYTHIVTATGTSNRTAFGQQTSAGSYNIFRPYASTDTASAAVNTGITGSITNTGMVGKFLLNRDVSGNYKIYKNGSLLTTVSNSSNTPTTLGNIAILALNNSLTATPSISSYFNDYLAIYISGSDMDAELSAFETAYDTYFNASR